jgi:O-antigen/teichoic acid export membrane protein
MARAAGWLFAGNLIAQALRLASSLILTRLLVPEAFGLMAAVNTLYFGLMMFSDLGIWQSIVRSERSKCERFLGTAWAIQILRGLLLAIGVLLLALGVDFASSQAWFAAGTVYADPMLPGLIAAFAVCALLQGFESIQLATAQRDMAARTMVRLELLTQLATIIFTVAAVWASRSVWALLAGTVFGSALKTGLSYTMLPGPRARLCWDAGSAREIISFGKWIFLSSIIGFLALQGEKLILGGLLGVVAFGIFSIASNLFAAAVGLYSTINGRVIFSSLSLVLQQNDPDALRRAYIRMQWLADLILGSVSGLLLLAGHWIIVLLYDQRYADAGWMLQCLGLGLLAMRYQVLEQLMFALGRPGWVTANNTLRAMSLLILVPAGYALAGDRGALWGVTASQFASWPLSLWFKHEQGLLCWATERGWPAGLAIGLLAGWAIDALLAAALS